MKRPSITLTGGTEAYYFRKSMPMRMLEDGTLVPASRSWRLVQWLRRLAWWTQTRTVCVAVDTECGTLTYVSLRWSWLRWKWVSK